MRPSARALPPAVDRGCRNDPPRATRSRAPTQRDPAYCVGRVTDVQRIVHERLRAAGAHVAVAHGIDQALAQLETWNLLRHDVAKAPRRAFAGNLNEAKP
jgi:hypothetical protein